MAGEKAFEFGNTVFIFLAALGAAWWIGTIMAAKGPDKLTTACAPIQYSVDGVQNVATGLVGYTPNWTLGTERFLVSGCYYFFDVMLSVGGNDHSGGSVSGGIRY